MKKFLSLLCALTLVLALVPMAHAEETITLRFSWWGGEARHESTLAAIALFEETHPGIKIEAEYSGWDGYQDKIVTQLASGTAPDIMQLDQPWLAQMVGEGANFLDLYTVSDKLDYSDMGEDFIKVWCDLDGKLLGLPTGISAQSFFQNTELLTSLGVDIPEYWTWENLIPAAKQLHEADPEKYLLTHDVGVISGHYLPIYLVQLTGGNYITDDYTLDFTQEDLCHYFTWVRDMFAVGGFEPETQAALYSNKQEQNPKWLNGDLAIMTNWCATYSEGSKNAGFTDAVEYARLENGVEDTISVRPSQVLSINGSSAHVDAALEFVNFFFNDEGAIRALGTCRSIPSGEKARNLLAADNVIDPAVAKAVDMATPRAARAVSAIASHSEVQKVLDDVCEMLCYGMLSPEDAAADCYEQLLEKLEELKSLQ